MLKLNSVGNHPPSKGRNNVVFSLQSSLNRNGNMHHWTEILVHPIGLAGYALCLVFGLFAKLKQRNERHWLFRAAISMALIALVGGLTLAYVEVKSSDLGASQPARESSKPSSQQQINQIQQTSTGQGSPNIQGVQGNITLTIDQSSAKLDVLPARKNTTPKKQKKSDFGP
jgi:hypothetical protein